MEISQMSLFLMEMHWWFLPLSKNFAQSMMLRAITSKEIASRGGSSWRDLCCDEEDIMKVAVSSSSTVCRVLGSEDRRNKWKNDSTTEVMKKWKMSSFEWVPNSGFQSFVFDSAFIFSGSYSGSTVVTFDNGHKKVKKGCVLCVWQIYKKKNPSGIWCRVKSRFPESVPCCLLGSVLYLHCMHMKTWRHEIMKIRKH